MIALSAMLSVGVAPAAEVGFESADAIDLEESVAAVNEGELQFLHRPPAKKVHRHFNGIDISPGSLADGWVSLRQCHENLDPVPSAQIVFRQDGIRGIRILSADSIGKAWVQGHTIQLEDVGLEARLCLTSESRALRSLGNGAYVLRNGPFMRRFLDGYYPMQVSMTISYPAEILLPLGHWPEAQDGFSVGQQEGEVSMDALFEGRLFTCFLFCDRRVGDCAADVAVCDAPMER